MPQAPRGTDALFLVDGYALIYRAFFAMIARPLTTRHGENTSAAWGVTNFLLRLRERHQPGFLGWVNDRGVSFRERLYPEYKATRQKLTAELQQDFDRSVERIAQLLEAFRVPLVTVEGFEADDVIGTLAAKATDQGVLSVIVSGDKDFYQLIGPRVSLLNPGRSGPAGVEEQWVDESNASERLGVPPRQVIDYLALVGDSSDNVPGVKGIGEKTAVELLSKYPDLETILSHAAEVPGKRAREALLAHTEEARLSKDLVTIRRDVPVTLDLDALRLKPFDGARLTELFTELEFRSLIAKVTGPEASAPAVRLTPAVAPPPPPTPTVSTEPARILDDVAALAGVIAECRRAPLIAIDTEASAIDPLRASLVGLSLAVLPGRSWYLPFGHRPPDGELAGGEPPRNLPALSSPELAPLRDLLTDASVRKAGHNIKYDWLVLRRAGVELGGVAYDSMLASFVLDPGRRSHAIDTLCLEHLGRAMQTHVDLIGKGKTEIPFAEVAVPAAANYCRADGAAALALQQFFAPLLAETSLEPLLRHIEMPLLKVLVDMEWESITIDRKLFQRLSDELGTDLRRLELEIAQAAGTDLNLNLPR